jgi:hypothetical protein
VAWGRAFRGMHHRPEEEARRASARCRKALSCGLPQAPPEIQVIAKARTCRSP